MSQEDATDLFHEDDDTDSFIVVKSENNLLKERIDTLAHTNGKLEISVRNLIKEIDDLQTINLDLEKQIQEKEDEKISANLKLKKAQEEIDILKHQLTRSNEEFKQVESNLKLQNQQSNELKSKLMAFNTSMENLKAQKFQEKEQDSDVNELKLQIEWLKVKVQMFEDNEIKNEQQFKILQEEKELLLSEQRTKDQHAKGIQEYLQQQLNQAKTEIEKLRNSLLVKENELKICHDLLEDSDEKNVNLEKELTRQRVDLEINANFKQNQHSKQLESQLSSVQTELANQKEILAKTLNESRDFRDENIHLKTSLEFYKNQFESLKKTNFNLNKQLTNYTQENDSFKTIFQILDDEKKVVIEEMNQVEQRAGQYLQMFRCTRALYGYVLVTQHYFNCRTCLIDGLGICLACVIVCHKNHDIVYVKKAAFNCHCQRQLSNCNALSFGFNFINDKFAS